MSGHHLLENAGRDEFISSLSSDIRCTKQSGLVGDDKTVTRMFAKRRTIGLRDL